MQNIEVEIQKKMVQPNAQFIIGLSLCLYDLHDIGRELDKLGRSTDFTITI